MLKVKFNGKTYVNVVSVYKVFSGNSLGGWMSHAKLAKDQEIFDSLLKAGFIKEIV